MPKKQEVQCYVWDITIDVEENFVAHTDIIHAFNAIGKKWAFQQERGEKKKRLHYQGRISLNEKARLSELKLLVPEYWHLTKTSNENKGNRFYVLKEETRIDGP